ncbi:type II CAAX endopeptidase family protein [Pedobacter aquatilis]|uniref:CPBP family intramembrane glutamic endopeptidase n=1 Tax=Pedobacter aquatilis TaxID=351343 RepID=UPI00292D5BEB|nr:type II CAAX endopeptidase family protein [Pedobacter aquatilis]
MNKIFPNNIFQALLLLGIGIVATAPIIFITQSYFDDLSVDIIANIMFIVFCIATISFAKVMNSRRKLDNNYRFTLPRNSPTLIGLTILIIIIFQVGVNAPLSNMLSYYQKGKLQLTNPFAQIQLFLGAVFLAPFFEEVIFRGTILKGFLTKYNPTLSIILSSVLFCAIHIQPVQLFGALFFGILSGWIYYRSESLGLCIFLHFLSNLSSQFISFLLFKATIYENLSPLYSYGQYTFFFIGISVLILSFLTFKLAGRLVKPKLISSTTHSAED